MTISQFFKTTQRVDGTSYAHMADDRPQWLEVAVYEAHDGETPNDWRYETIVAVVEALEELDDPDDPDGSVELAESLVDVSTCDLVAWLAADVGRISYVDDEQDSAPAAGLFAQLQAGQYRAIDGIRCVMAAAIAGSVERSEASQELLRSRMTAARIAND